MGDDPHDMFSIATLIVAVSIPLITALVSDQPILDKLLFATIFTALLSAAAYKVADTRTVRIACITVVLLVVAIFLFVFIRSTT